MHKILTFLTLISIIGSCTEPIPSTKNTQILIAFQDTSQNWGFKDTSGQVVIPPQYSMVFEDSFVHDIAFVVEKKYDSDDERHGIIAIDKNNKMILKPFIFDNGPDYLQEGLFRFVEKGQMGFADVNGKKVIPAKYIFVEAFQEGFAAFCEGCKKETMGEHWRMVGGKWGFMDKNGKVIIEPQFQKVTNFKEGVAEVTKDTSTFNINPKGERVK